MRKLIVVFMALMLCLQVFSGSVVFGAEGDNRLSVSFTQTENDIDPGDSVSVRLNCTNISAETITDLYADISSGSSFTQVVEGKTTKLADTLLAAGEVNNAPYIQLKYLGTGDNLNVTFSYKVSGVSQTEDVNLHVLGVNQKDTGSTPSSPVDTSKYTPKLENTNSTSIPSITAGNTQRLNFTIKNNSIYQARNVKISLKMADEAKAPLVLDNFDLRQRVDYINGNESKDISFDIGILAGAPEGLYALKLNYDYENAYNDPPFSTSETVYIRVRNDNANPKLTVNSVAVRQDEKSKDSIFLDLSVRNLGKLAARDVKVTLQGLKSGGFTTYNSTDIKYVDTINGGGSETVSYQLRMPASGAAGSNELSVKMEYHDTTGNSFSEQNQIFVPAGEGEGSRPDISFDKIASPQSALGTGEEFTVGLDLKNNGGAGARNIKVSLAADAALIIKSMNPVYVDKLGANGSKNISFKLFAADDAVTKNYPIAINVEYEDAFGTKYTAAQYIGAYVESNSGKSVPRIIIDNYSMEPFPVNAGDDFKLKMSFLNTSKTVDVSNIKVTVSSDDGTFTPTDSGNTFYIEGISSSQNVERELMLHVKPDAEQKSYMLTVNFEYEDGKGNPFTAKETMSVRVLQSPRLVTGDLNPPPEAFVGQPVQIYLDFYNMGKSTLYNLMIKLEGEFDGQNLSYYVGNFESGRTDFFDVSAMPRAAGQQKGSVLFSYEDANGKKTELRKEFTLNVTEMAPQGPMVDGGGMPVGKDGMVIGPDGKPMPMPGAGPSKPSLLVYIGAGAGLLVIALIVFIILRKRHNRRKEMSLDE
ncbi:MAG TPA: CARDB domain-containing protein [Clostridia bacterium]|nr:CARDB domain-containing protein [Clostridia bacterium]